MLGNGLNLCRSRLGSPGFFSKEPKGRDCVETWHGAYWRHSRLRFCRSWDDENKGQGREEAKGPSGSVCSFLGPPPLSQSCPSGKRRKVSCRCKLRPVASQEVQAVW